MTGLSVGVGGNGIGEDGTLLMLFTGESAGLPGAGTGDVGQRLQVAAQ